MTNNLNWKKDNTHKSIRIFFFRQRNANYGSFQRKNLLRAGIYGNTEGKTDLRVCQRSDAHFEYQGKHKFAICWTCFARTDWQFKSRWNLKRFYSENVLTETMSTMELPICNSKLGGPMIFFQFSTGLRFTKQKHILWNFLERKILN